MYAFNSFQYFSLEGLINLTGKSFVCILHEYCQNVIRRPPTYQTVVQENDRNPYQLTVVIDGKPCATGSGQSKKQARLDAGEWIDGSELLLGITVRLILCIPLLIFLPALRQVSFTTSTVFVTHSRPSSSLINFACSHLLCQGIAFHVW